ncbi:Prolyl tripeptidyl peptidase [Trichostrongylus colubriformis]|uniref:Prolyl tripeptidyl peptidase n=1 Tax=Trichostrongylus colubriformis TaxID=6319 RepID=A0AAN8ISG2_TRICO
MGEAGLEAYNATDIIADVSNFRKTRLLLIHGLYDDTVDFQHSALLMEALQLEGIDFDAMVYPNQDHQLLFVRTHLYGKIIAFLDNCAKH